MMDPKVTWWADKNGPVVVDFRTISVDTIKANRDNFLGDKKPLKGGSPISAAIMPQDLTAAKFQQLVKDRSGFQDKQILHYEIQPLSPLRKIQFFDPAQNKTIDGLELYAVVYNKYGLGVATRLLFSNPPSIGFAFLNSGLGRLYADPCCANALKNTQDPRGFVRPGMSVMISTSGELSEIESVDVNKQVSWAQRIFSAASLSTFPFSESLP